MQMHFSGKYTYLERSNKWKVKSTVSTRHECFSLSKMEVLNLCYSIRNKNDYLL